jgi:hypothetical protein
MEIKNISLELRKRKDKSVVIIGEKELQFNSDKILQMLKKECVDLKTWFYIIVKDPNIVLLLVKTRLCKF